MSAANPYLTDPTPDGRIADALGDVRRLVDQALRNMGTAGAGSVKFGALAADSITTAAIVAGSITTDLLAADAVVSSKIAANTIVAGDIAAGTITATELAAGTITGDRIAAGTITASNITAGTITGDRIAAATITGDRLVGNTITAGQIAAGTITATELAAHTVTAAKIAAGTITAAEIAAATITGGLIAASTITATNIATGTITSGLLAADAVTSTAIAAGAVTATKISVSSLSAISADLGTITAGTVTGATLRTASSGKRVVIDSTGITAYGGTGSTAVLNFDTTTGNLSLLGTVTASSSSIIPAGTISASAGGIVSGQIQDGTIVGADIAANTIAANNIIAGTITATELATDSVTSVKILAATIVAGDIASGTITATQIAAGTITADRLSVTQLSAIAADLGSVTAGTVTGALLRTSSSSPRVELAGSANAIRTYDSGGTQVQQIDGTVGVSFLAPTSTSGANKQSIRWTTTIAGGTEAAKLWAYSTAGGQSAIDAQCATTALSTEAYGSVSAYNFAGHRNYLEVAAIANNAGGRVKAVVRNQADTADLATTIIDNNGDLTVNRKIVATLDNGVLFASVNGVSLYQPTSVTNYLRLKPAAAATNAFINILDGGGTSRAWYGGDATGPAIYNDDGTIKAVSISHAGTVTLGGGSGGVVVNGADRNNSLVVSANQSGILLTSTGSGGASWDMFSALSGGGGAGALNFYKESAGVYGGYVDGSGFHNISDAAVKEHFAPLDDADVLARVTRLPVQSWQYKQGDDGRRHIGPTAQDFAATFGIGDGRGIGTVDAAGVSLAAIGALARRSDRLEAGRLALEHTIRWLANDVGDAIGGKPGRDLAGRLLERLELELELAAV